MGIVEFLRRELGDVSSAISYWLFGGFVETGGGRLMPCRFCRGPGDLFAWDSGDDARKRNQSEAGRSDARRS